MKRFLTIVTITIALMTLTSCGNRGQKTNTDNDAAAAAVDTVAVDTVAVDTVVVE